MLNRLKVIYHLLRDDDFIFIFSNDKIKEEDTGICFSKTISLDVLNAAKKSIELVCRKYKITTEE